MTAALSRIYTRRFNFFTNAFLPSNRKIPNQNAMHSVAFYLGLKNDPWFGRAGSENAYIFRMSKQRVATQLLVRCAWVWILGILVKFNIVN